MSTAGERFSNSRPKFEHFAPRNIPGGAHEHNHKTTLNACSKRVAPGPLRNGTPSSKHIPKIDPDAVSGARGYPREHQGCPIMPKNVSPLK